MVLKVFPGNSNLNSQPSFVVYPVVKTAPLPDPVTDVQSWRDRAVAAGGTVEAVDLNALNTFAEGIYNLGLRSRVDPNEHLILELLPLAGSNLSACLTKLWYPQLASRPSSISFQESDYSRATGLTGGNGAKYLNSAFIPQRDGMLRESCAVGLYNRTAGGTDYSVEIGSFTILANGSNNRIVLHTHTVNGITAFQCFSDGAGEFNYYVPPSETSLGFVLGNRISVNDCRIYKRGLDVFFTSALIGDVPANPITYFAQLDSIGNPILVSPRSIGLFLLSKGIPTEKVAPLNTLIENLMTALGRAV